MTLEYNHTSSVLPDIDVTFINDNHIEIRTTGSGNIYPYISIKKNRISLVEKFILRVFFRTLGLRHYYQSQIHYSPVSCGRLSDYDPKQLFMKSYDKLNNS